MNKSNFFSPIEEEDKDKDKHARSEYLELTDIPVLKTFLNLAMLISSKKESMGWQNYEVLLDLYKKLDPGQQYAQMTTMLNIFEINRVLPALEFSLQKKISPDIIVNHAEKYLKEIENRTSSLDNKLTKGPQGS